MADIETLGRRVGCSVLSIGAVAFDPATRSLGPTFYTIISRRSCREAGLHEDPSTLAWWSRQSDAARTVLMEVDSVAAPTLTDALTRFSAYLANFSPNRRLWGNGADFDNAIVAHLYQVAGLPLPWRYTNNRCYRTLKSLLATCEIRTERAGVHHNSLDDAVHQATHACELLNTLRGMLKVDSSVNKGSP